MDGGENKVDKPVPLDPTAIAYLWMAVELNLNILIIGEGVNGLINFLAGFILDYRTVLDLRDDSRSNGRINYATLSAKSRDFRSIREKTIGIFPDRVIYETENGHVNDIFAMSRYGISFMAAARCGPCNNLVKSLLSKQFGVSNSNIHMLDIAVWAGSSGTVSKITEYKWLDRAEMIANKDRLASKRYSNMLIMGYGRVYSENLPESKVLKAYSRMNIVGKGGVRGELVARKLFVEDAMMAGAPINPESYYDIR